MRARPEAGGMREAIGMRGSVGTGTAMQAAAGVVGWRLELG